MEYIGIRGHRGAGKKSVSYLLGNTISSILNNDMDDFDKNYNNWVNDMMEYEFSIYRCNLNKVYFDSFSDTLKLFIQLLIGVPNNYLYEDYYKDHIVVNIKDFSYKEYQELPTDIKILTKDELYEIMVDLQNPIALTKNLYITLRDLILYFGIDVMQRFFGLNVWVKCLKNSASQFESIFTEDDYYKIFIDVKTPSEVTYILDNGGVIIDIKRKNNKKKSKGFDKLSKDGRIDYTIYVDGGLYDLKDQILEIANDIVNRNKKHD